MAPFLILTQITIWSRGSRIAMLSIPTLDCCRSTQFIFFLQMVAWVNSNPSHLRGQKQANVSQKTGRIEWSAIQAMTRGQSLRQPSNDSYFGQSSQCMYVYIYLHIYIYNILNCVALRYPIYIVLHYTTLHRIALSCVNIYIHRMLYISCIYIIYIY